MVPIIFLALAALGASGLLYKHKSLLTYLSLAAILWELAWLGITLIDRTLFSHISGDSVYVVLAGLLLLATGYALRKNSFTFPVAPGWYDAKRDLTILFVCAIVIGASVSVWNRNGFEEHAWVSHSFFNGDTTTFMALVQRSFHTPTLVNENPFSANGTLEYPSLLHAGVASFFMQLGMTSGSGWLNLLPVMTYGFIFLTIPAFFLIFEATTLRKLGLVAAGGIVLYVLSLSWDGYVYPQSHFFLTGLFLLLVFLLLRAPGKTQAPVHEGLAFTAVTVLLFSNAITGVAAAGLFIAHTLLRPSNGRLLLSLAVIILYFFASPGNASIGTVHFSYVATDNMLRLFPVVAILFILLLKEYKAYPLQSLATALLSLAAFGIFFFSDRGIVRENASRFFYHAILIAFPILSLALPFATKHLKDAYRTFAKGTPHTTTPIVLLLVTGVFLALPAGASIISTHDNLWRKDKQVIDTGHRLALWWIEDNTPANAVFLANPYAPFSIPAFTGRSLLRSNYWLSTDDIVRGDVIAALEGDRAALENILPLVDYIYLAQDQREKVEPLVEGLEKVFDSNAIVIYKTAR